jgi:quercetin dioxygenase-like cupin family protein
MDQAQFEADVKAKGCDAIETLELKADMLNEPHTHDFSASVYVLEGEISVTTDTETTTCRAGDTFTLPAGTSHHESVGGDGVRFLIGKF